jgi:hypothetical protein
MCVGLLNSSLILTKLDLLIYDFVQGARASVSSSRQNALEELPVERVRGITRLNLKISSEAAFPEIANRSGKTCVAPSLFMTCTESHFFLEISPEVHEGSILDRLERQGQSRQGVRSYTHSG